MNEDVMKLTDDELQQLTSLLQKLEPGFQPFPVFEQLARITVLAGCELVPLRRNKTGEVEILLMERLASDTQQWPGMVHTPGSILLANEADGGFAPILERIRVNELEGVELAEPQYVGPVFHRSRRGAEMAVVYYAEVLDEPPRGAFYPANQLPDNLIESQHDFIAQAAEAFKKHEA